MAKVFLDAEGNPIKQGFYREGVTGDIYYFDKQTTRTREGVIPELNEEVECWEVRINDECGRQTDFVNVTQGSPMTSSGYYPVSDETVRKKIGFLRKRADWLEEKL